MRSACAEISAATANKVTASTKSACAMAAIVLLACKRGDGEGWEFAHDWLPLVFFTSAFEEVAFLSLALRSGFQGAYIIRFEWWLFRTSPNEWVHSRAREWLVEFLQLGYFAFYPLYPIVGGCFWSWRRYPRFCGAFRRLTDTLSIGYVICYSTYLLFPTQSPANMAGVQEIGSAHPGVFQRLVRLIQDRAGVHGNAFPARISCWRSSCWCSCIATCPAWRRGC